MAVTVRHPAWFGAVIRQAMVVRGHHAQADLSTASGLSVNTVVNVVTGSRDSYRRAPIEHLAHGLSVPSMALVAVLASLEATQPGLRTRLRPRD